jgi:hypothetical protein
MFVVLHFKRTCGMTKSMLIAEHALKIIMHMISMRIR